MFKNMYKNIGGKIKGLAKGLFIAQAIIYALSAFVGTIIAIVNSVVYETNPLLIVSYVLLGLILGFAIAVLGILLAWISTWVLYGFGELVEKVTAGEDSACVPEKTKVPAGKYAAAKAPAKREAPKTIAQEKVMEANKS